ncbi:MAG TPA: B12-binding domain-containing radical SAM protein, partial [Bacteroidales bacterium]|nr:B12-binding domain-containing radical SAM protein [Bacteroidales bacterium]
TDETIDESFENSKLIDNTVFFPYVGMRIYPGTELYDRAVSEGRISDPRELLNPVYYVSQSVTMEKLKEKAALTGKRWVFPDFDNTAVMLRLRARNKKGPLWEYLRQ